MCVASMLASLAVACARDVLVGLDSSGDAAIHSDASAADAVTADSLVADSRATDGTVESSSKESGSPGPFCPDAGADPVAGIWVGSQGGETWTFSFCGGSVHAMAINDSCSGAYAVTGNATATGLLDCHPLNPQGTATHTDNGTFTVTNGVLIDYVYASSATDAGLFSWTGTLVTR